MRNSMAIQDSIKATQKIANPIKYYLKQKEVIQVYASTSRTGKERNEDEKHRFSRKTQVRSLSAYSLSEIDL